MGLDSWRRQHLQQIFRTKGRAGIEAWWQKYYEAHPEKKPEFIQNPVIAMPYGQNPEDWYEAHEIEAFLDAGFEWDSTEGMWRHWEDEEPLEDSYDEDSEA